MESQGTFPNRHMVNCLPNGVVWNWASPHRSNVMVYMVLLRTWAGHFSSGRTCIMVINGIIDSMDWSSG